MKMQTKGYNAQGFLTKWLFSGPLAVPYTPQIAAKDFTDQLAYEKQLRTELCKAKTVVPPTEAHLGEPSPLGMPWVYWYRHGGWFLDESTFYSSLTEVRCCAAVCITADKAKTVPAILWTYAAVTLWVNGKEAVQIVPAVYKPIAKREFVLSLQEGENFLFLHLQNLGVRDTRTIAGVQLLDLEGIAADVPGGAPHCAAAADWLDTLRATDDCIFTDKPAPCPAVLRCGGHEIPFHAKGVAKMPVGHLATVCCQTQQGELFRLLELTERKRPGKSAAQGTTQEENRLHFLQTLAQQPCLQRDSSVRFSVFHVLARLAVGEIHPEDPERLLYDLAMIDRRIDCADFLITGLIRLLRCYSDRLPKSFLQRTRTTLCNFRYWMDEEGADGMCFWSENHALMFYGAQLLVGEMYPDAVFAGGLTGAALGEKGARRCREWLEEAKRTGLEEFNSAGYTLVSTAALMNLVDFGPADISADATACIDAILHRLAPHIFRGTAISPQGRVYRDVIYPFGQSVQAMLGFLYPEFPSAMEDEGMWNACFATSRYSPPVDVPILAARDFHGEACTGNARIVLKKTAYWLLTSVRSPRAPEDTPQWENLCFVQDAPRDTNLYVKSLNERFHGTTVFEPGVYGYQQHLWYAALSPDCVVFTTHPGSPVDMDGMRPGYWHGNGVLPALSQQGDTLLCVYSIPPEHPITFTHVYWPAVRMQRQCSTGGWLFGCLGSGYLGVWCSGEIQPYNDVLTHCEYRCYDTSVAYVCRCGDAYRWKDFESFMDDCRKETPLFNPKTETILDRGRTLTFVRGENKTQYI